LANSESNKYQKRSYTVAERNAADGISMAQTAEGALGEVHDVLGRMRELAMQAANGSLTDTDRSYISTEFGSLQNEIGRIQQSTNFNGQAIIGSSTTAAVTLQVGLGSTSENQISITFNNLNLDNIIGTATTSVASQGAALTALDTIDAAIGSVSESRSNFGAAMNKLEVATNNIQTMRINISSANSRIRDVDVAEESAKMAKNQVLTQSSISILAQANQLPQLAFSLIGG
jgi:flagellin